MKQLEVPIMGQAYVLACPDDSETRMLEAVQRVDAAMCRIRDAGKIRARDRIAVLAALNMAFDLLEKEQHATPAPAADAPAQSGNSGELVHPRLQMLLERMDRTLAEDGRLI